MGWQLACLSIKHEPLSYNMIRVSKNTVLYYITTFGDKIVCYIICYNYKMTNNIHSRSVLFAKENILTHLCMF